MKDIPQSKRDPMIALHLHTYKTYREIVADIGVSVNAVGLFIKKYRETGETQTARKGHCGRKPILSSREKSLISRESKKNPRLCSSAIKLATGQLGEKVSKRTVQRVLKEQGRKAYRPARAPQLNSAKRGARFEWARTHKVFNRVFWEKVKS